MPEAPLFVSRNSARGSARARCKGILTGQKAVVWLPIAKAKEFKNAKLVQRYLGHSDVATTLRYYVDVFPEDLEEAAEMLAER